MHGRARRPLALPLRPGDDEPELALTPLLHALYERAGYDLRVDYRGEPEPAPRARRRGLGWRCPGGS